MKLFSGVREITREAAKVRFDTTTQAPNKFRLRPGYEPTQALDDNLETKWFDDRAISAKTMHAVYLTRDGCRLVACRVGDAAWRELVPTNALPANLPPGFLGTGPLDGDDFDRKTARFTH